MGTDQNTARITRSTVRTLYISTPHVSGNPTLGLVRDLVEAAIANGVPLTEQVSFEQYGSPRKTSRVMIVFKEDVSHDPHCDGHR